MERKQKIQELLLRLNKLQAERLELPDYVDKQLADERANMLTASETSPTALALKRIARDVNKFQRSPAVKNLFKLRKRDAMERDEKFAALEGIFSEKFGLLEQELVNSNTKGQATEAYLADFKKRMDALTAEFDAERTGLGAQTLTLAEKVAKLESTIPVIEDGANTALLETAAEVVIASETASNALKTATEASLPGITALENIKRLEQDLLNRINAIAGAGNAQRSIVIAGNKDTLKYYTDINLKAGSGVTITYTPNHATGYTDVTIAATGGGGGITREINNVATPTAMGDTAGIDYVYLVSGNTTVTLPTAVGNENLYTVKNVGSGTVIINTTGGETIDSDSNVTMPVQFTSVDLISNGANWNIT